MRDPVEDELLADQPHRVDRAHAVLGQLVVRRRLEQEAVAIGGRELLELLDQRGVIAAVRGPGAGRAVLVGRHGKTSKGARIAGRSFNPDRATTLGLTPGAGIPRNG